MKKVLKGLYGLLYNFFVGLAIATVVGCAAWIPITGLFALGCIKMPSGVAFMAVQKEIWIADIIESLWRNNQFLEFAFNADQYVLAGKVVHIPQAGAAPAVSKNRGTLPATVAKRTDTDITYAIDEFTTDPVLIPNADTVEVSYDKRQSVLAETLSSISQTVADWMLYNWSPSAAVQILRTSGALVAAHMPSATTTRKKFMLADLKAANKLMDKQDVPLTDRYCMMSADMYDQITDEMTATQYRDFSNAYDAAKGIMGEVYGFKIMKRSYVLCYDNTATPVVKQPGAAGAATDNDAVLCWQKNMVERALGTVDFFDNVGDPTYYGDIYSSLVRMGGRKRRADDKGVVAIIQTP
jgi:hypothetical protein